MAKHYERLTSVVWCDFHGEVHAATTDIYQSGEDECGYKNWRGVFMLLDDDEDASGM